MVKSRILVINAFIGYKPLADRYFDTYGDDAYLIYPAWSNGLGMYWYSTWSSVQCSKVTLFFISANTVAFLAFIPIPLYFIYALAKWGKQSFYPTAEWGAREQVQSESLQKGTFNLKLYFWIEWIWNIFICSENPAFDERSEESQELWTSRAWDIWL